MELPIEITTVMSNIMRYFMMHGQELPNYQREKIIALMGPGTSPVDFVVKSSEYLYAVAADLSPEGQEVAAQTAFLAAVNGWHGMTTRGQQMVNYYRREAGETVTQDPDNDAPILMEYAEPLVPETTPTPVPATMAPPVSNLRTEPNGEPTP